MIAAGQEDATEIIGSRGKVTVNAQPALNLVNVFDNTGIYRKIPNTTSIVSKKGSA
ncbi:uncharacterized protein BDW70DRAFT_160781 [Aspergillus foveolatus]|uniref:uncharacterized protein n=1 Tax=Aspergillus foveolatus TaxID=210207 RepID=UPI003CCE2B58